MAIQETEISCYTEKLCFVTTCPRNGRQSYLILVGLVSHSVQMWLLTPTSFFWEQSDRLQISLHVYLRIQDAGVGRQATALVMTVFIVSIYFSALYMSLFFQKVVFHFIRENQMDCLYSVVRYKHFLKKSEQRFMNLFLMLEQLSTISSSYESIWRKPHNNSLFHEVKLDLFFFFKETQ